jgi:hypothetical protein
VPCLTPSLPVPAETPPSRLGFDQPGHTGAASNRAMRSRATDQHGGRDIGIALDVAHLAGHHTLSSTSHSAGP